MDDFLLPDPYVGLKRGPQVMLPKDIGIVMAYTGVGKESVCVDAGTGSGWLAVSLGRCCKQVTTYDTVPEFANIAKRNAAKLHLDNLTFKEGDVLKGIDEKEVDLVTLDMPNSDKAVKNAAGALAAGGHLFGYLPHMEQVKNFVLAMRESGFENIIVIEAIVRDILVREQGVRPSTKGVWHTAYLAFGQKPKKD